MFLTNRNIMSAVIILLSGLVLWIIPAQVRGDNQLLAMNSTLLPALAISLILILALFDLVMSLFHASKSIIDRRLAHDNDVVITKAQVLGSCLVVVLMVLFALLLFKIGYLLASVILLVGLMLGTGGRRHPLTIILTSTVAVGVLYLGLRYGLGLHLQILPDLTFLKG